MKERAAERRNHEEILLVTGGIRMVNKQEKVTKTFRLSKDVAETLKKVAAGLKKRQSEILDEVLREYLKPTGK